MQSNLTHADRVNLALLSLSVSPALRDAIACLIANALEITPQNQIASQTELHEFLTECHSLLEPFSESQKANR